MRKTDRKMDNQIRASLTEVCEHALVHIQDFQWLTHHVDYQRFPESLRVICVFDTNESLAEAFSRGDDDRLRQLVNRRLLAIGIRLSDIETAVSFISEESGNTRNTAMGSTGLH
jgi:hypothetical protein